MSHVTHWLVAVAQRAGMRVADRREYAEATLEEVWAGVIADTEVPATEIAETVSAHFRLEPARLAEAHPAAMRLVPKDVARGFQIMPLHETDHTLVVATADPTNLDAEQAIAFASGRTVEFAVAPPAALQATIDEHYPPETAAEGMLRESDLDDSDVTIESEEDNPILDVSEVDSEPVIKLTNLIFKEAIDAGASDVHVEPDADGGSVRIRVDGVLRKHMELPQQALIRVISRIKVLGDLDIADHIRPQDGRARIRVGSRAYDLRISTVPSRGSEKVVIRILDPGKTMGGLEDLYVPEPELSQLRRVTRHRDGIVVVTGPTGSGKTTTLYSLLQELATDRVNIMTVEDPVEYRLSGITQIQVEKKRGVTFANTLRAILRQDPDIIFVGEIRDLETAEIAVQASMTGHLVLATLHTNDAPAAVQRLLDLGLDGPSLAGTLRASLAQRLVRATCVECMGVGCDHCGHTGFSGRRPIMELMVLDPATTALIADEAPHPEIRASAIRAGMRPLNEVGYEMIRSGVSTKDEVERVLGEVAAPRDPDVDSREATRKYPVDTPPPGEAVVEVMPAIDFNQIDLGQIDLGQIEPIAIEAQEVLDIQLPDPEPAPPRSTRPPVPERAAPTESSAPIPSAAPTDGAARVLVVDDDPVSRTIARSLLEGEGLEVTEAGDGMGAIQAIAAGMQFELCILDLNMPNVDGRQVLQEIRSTASTAEMPVIVLTGNSDSEAEIELMQAGADDYIRKPLDAGRFLVRVKATLRRAGIDPAIYGGVV